MNPYAVKYSLGRAWVYSMLSVGLWTAYWFYVNRKLFDGRRREAATTRSCTRSGSTCPC